MRDTATNVATVNKVIADVLSRKYLLWLWINLGTVLCAGGYHGISSVCEASRPDAKIGSNALIRNPYLPDMPLHVPATGKTYLLYSTTATAVLFPMSLKCSIMRLCHHRAKRQL